MSLDNIDQHQSFISSYDGYDDEMSDAESCITRDAKGNDEADFQGSLFEDDLMVRLSQDDSKFRVLENKFLSSLRDFEGVDATIEAVHKINWSRSRYLKARLFSFYVCVRTLLNNGLGTNYDDDEDDDGTYGKSYGWYCDSKQGIQKIVSDGFGYREFVPYVGIRLTPINSPLQSNLRNCVDDDDGLKHVLLCQVLMKKEEISDATSSSDEYVVPETKMNSHILPAYVVSFRINQPLFQEYPLPTTVTNPLAPGAPIKNNGLANDLFPFSKVGNRQTTDQLVKRQGLPQARKRPTSPWLPFATLISIIAKFLPPSTMDLIHESYKKFKDGKISRQDWVEKLKRYAGTDLLIHSIKECGFKEKQNPVSVYSRKDKPTMRKDNVHAYIKKRKDIDAYALQVKDKKRSQMYK